MDLSMLLISWVKQSCLVYILLPQKWSASANCLTASVTGNLMKQKATSYSEKKVEKEGEDREKVKDTEVNSAM